MDEKNYIPFCVKKTLQQVKGFYFIVLQIFVHACIYYRCW
jgi:hypothetical protein